MEIITCIDDPTSRSIPVELIRLFDSGEEFLVHQSLSRTGGAKIWHHVTSIEDVLELLENKPTSKLDFYQMPNNCIAVLSAKGQAY